MNSEDYGSENTGDPTAVLLSLISDSNYVAYVNTHF